jgi:hypothetical protein
MAINLVSLIMQFLTPDTIDTVKAKLATLTA